VAGEDKDYLVRVVQLPCAARFMSAAHPCGGIIVAHHRSTGRVARAPMKGGDRRSHDHDTIPLCAVHHNSWHAASQPFKIMIRAEREAWEEQQVFRIKQLLKPVSTLQR
jgi:hypothetical protein